MTDLFHLHSSSLFILPPFLPFHPPFPSSPIFLHLLLSSFLVMSLSDHSMQLMKKPNKHFEICLKKRYLHLKSFTICTLTYKCVMEADEQVCLFLFLFFLFFLYLCAVCCVWGGGVQTVHMDVYVVRLGNTHTHIPLSCRKFHLIPRGTKP